MTTEQQTQQIMFASAYQDFKRDLSTHAFFKVHDRSMSEDLVQDTFIKAWKYLLRGGKIDTMKTFLYHILNHLIIDQYRKHKTESLDNLIEKGYEPKSEDPKILFSKLDGDKLILLIESLPVTYRSVIYMRYIKDLTLEEIATATGKSKNTVAVQIHRGLEKLKLLYKPIQFS